MVSSYTQLLAKRYKGKLDANADEFIGYAVDGANAHAKAHQRPVARLVARGYAGPPERAGRHRRDSCGSVLSPTCNQRMEAAAGAIGGQHPEAMPTVFADRTQIGQLFQNMVGNALKFRGEAAPRVEIRVERVENGGFWQFAFQDNGIGIEPQYFERIFVIFQRLHNKESYPGTGIGLAICKKIVERHGGKLWLESNIGAGTTFFFTLPAVPDSQEGGLTS